MASHHFRSDFIGENAVEVANADPERQLPELVREFTGGMVKVFGFRDQGEEFPLPHTVCSKDAAERFKRWGIDVEQFVFVELDFHRDAVRQNRNPRTAIVGQEVFKIAEVAGKHRRIDVVAAKIGVRIEARVVAAFQDDVYDGSERFKQGKEDIEERFGGNSRGKHGKAEFRSPIAKDIHSISLARTDRQARTGPDGVGQGERAIGING